MRTGSRGIFVWESTDLVNWVKERLVVVEDATAGMVWAPEAIWDPDKSESHIRISRRIAELTSGADQYMVFWASKFVRTNLILPPDRSPNRAPRSD